MKKLLCILLLPVSVSRSKVQVFANGTSEKFSARFQRKPKKLDFFTNLLTKRFSGNYQLVLKAQTDNFLLEQHFLVDFVNNYQLKKFPNLTLSTVLDQFEIAKWNKVRWKLKKTSTFLLLPKHFYGRTLLTCKLTSFLLKAAELFWPEITEPPSE